MLGLKLRKELKQDLTKKEAEKIKDVGEAANSVSSLRLGARPLPSGVTALWGSVG